MMDLFSGGFLGSLIPFLVILTVVVFFHELGHFWVGRLIRHTGRIAITQEFHISAQRNDGETPTRAAFVVEGEQFGTEADRESFDLDATQAADPEMA